MSTELWLDGVDAAATYGLRLAVPDGVRNLPSSRLETIAIPDVPGVTLLTEPIIEPRTIALAGVLKGSSAADVRTKRDRLFAVLRRSSVRLRLADATTRELPFIVTNAKITSTGPQMLASVLPIAIEGLALSPYWVDTTPQSISVSTTPTALPLGTAPVAPVITAANPGSALTITLRDALGVTVTALQLAGLEAGVAVVIDCAARTIRQGAVSVITALINGDFPLLDVVTQGDFAASAWPTLAMSQGTATVTYARRWA